MHQSADIPLTYVRYVVLQTPPNHLNAALLPMNINRKFTENIFPFPLTLVFIFPMFIWTNRIGNEILFYNS